MFPERRLGWPLALFVLTGAVVLLLVLPLWQAVPAGLTLAVTALLLRPWLAKPVVSARLVGLVFGFVAGVGLAYLIAWATWLLEMEPQARVFVVLVAGSCLLGLSGGLSWFVRPSSDQRLSAATAAVFGAASCLVLLGILALVFWDYWVD